MVVVFVGIAGLAMTTCGIFFSLASVAEKEMLGLLIISVPAALIGVFLLWLSWKIWKGSRDTPPAATPPASSPPPPAAP
jgi:hypothetical protein